MKNRRGQCIINYIVNVVGIIVLVGFFFVGKEVAYREKSIYQEQSIYKSYDKQNVYQEQIAEEILRFHVIANSDSEKDQSLKLKVKEGILSMLRPMLSDAKNIQEAETIIFNHMKEIEKEADEIIEKEGYSYKSQGLLGKTTFPIKRYGDMVFPAGEYEAFRILLGEAQGKNWWCVMFPTLCYVDEVYDVITKENKEQFKEILTKAEYESLFAMEELENVELGLEKEELENKKLENEKIQEKTFYKLKSTVWLNKVIDYFKK